MRRMRGKCERGFTLIEVMVATALLMVVIVIATDSLVDILNQKSREDLSYQVNQDARRLLEQMTQDIESAGFRTAGPNYFGAGMPAISAVSANNLVMRCVSDLGQLSAAVAAGGISLTVQGFKNLPAVAAGVLLTFNGQVEYVTVSTINKAANTIILSSGVGKNYPVGTIVSTVNIISYQVDAGAKELVRSVNGAVVSRVPVDIATTTIGYTLRADTDGDTNKNEGETADVTTLTSTDQLDDLLTVNISLTLTRASAGTRGRTVSITQTATQRITPLNLKPYNG